MPWIARGFSLLLIAVTLAPLVRTGAWYVRVWDFPRLQIAAMLAIVVFVWVLWGAGGAMDA